MNCVDKRISLTALLNAKKQLDFAINNAHSELEITGAIKCFEYCFELSWKTMKKFLESMGVIEINSPRAVFAAAFRNQLIDNINIWNTFITQRNLTSHTYDQELAHEIFETLNIFSHHLDLFIQIVQRNLQ